MKSFKAKHFQIQFDTWGDPKDKAILFFHGFPGSHVQAAAIAPIVRSSKIFLVACDRPGYGGTIGNGTPADFLSDTKTLLTELDIKKFTILGVSGGSPWSHMMASLFSENVQSLGILCGLSPYNFETKKYFSKFQDRGLLLSRYLPNTFAEKILGALLLTFQPEKGLEKFVRYLSPADQEILHDPKIRGLIFDSMKQSRTQGAKGILFDTAVYSRDWLKEDCDLKRLESIPTLYFHGQEDHILDYGMTEWMHSKNPRSKVHFFAKHGHYSLPFLEAARILSTLKENSGSSY